MYSQIKKILKLGDQLVQCNISCEAVNINPNKGIVLKF